MASTSRRRDAIRQSSDIAERVRKLEVMSHTRTLLPKQWKPARDDLYAIAGHIMMLGCFRSRHGPNGVLQAHPGPAAQVLWALLDQRGFTSPAEGQDWTLFLMKLGAIPPTTAWPSVVSGEPSGDMVAEARSQMGYGPTFVIRWNDGNTGSAHANPNWKALYFNGLPEGVWNWRNAGTFFGTSPDGDDVVTPNLLSLEIGDPEIDYAIVPEFGSNPVQRGGGLEFIPPGGVGGGDGVIYNDNTYGFSAQPCGGPIEPPYTAAFPGLPVGPYDSGEFPCPNAPPGTVFMGGAVWRVKTFAGAIGASLYLIAPPRQQSAALYSGNASFSAQSVSFGIDWMAEAVEAAIGSHPFVAGFYADHLPMALAKKTQSPRYRWQSLDIGVQWRGHVEARRERYGVMLRGQLHWEGNTDYNAIYGDLMFIWPDSWPDPGEGPGDPAYTFIHDGSQEVMISTASNEGFQYFTIFSGWAQNTGYTPTNVDLFFDGAFITTNMTLSTFP